MSKGILSIIGLGTPEPSEETEGDSYQDRKATAAQEALDAISDNDAEGFADAVTALVRLCKLEGMKSTKTKSTEMEE